MAGWYELEEQRQKNNTVCPAVNGRLVLRSEP
jgi:hypothetical protein